MDQLHLEADDLQPVAELPRAEASRPQRLRLTARHGGRRMVLYAGGGGAARDCVHRAEHALRDSGRRGRGVRRRGGRQVMPPEHARAQVPC